MTFSDRFFSNWPAASGGINVWPVYLVFEYNRMAVVHAVDIEPSLLHQAPPDLQTLPWRGPTLLSLRPLQGNEAIESVLQAVGGIAQAAQPNL